MCFDPKSMYAALIFLTSAGALILEIAAGRLIAPYVGMSLYTWTAIIAVVLAGLSVGHWVGGRLADTGADDRSAVLRMTLALGAAAVFTVAALPLLRAVAGWVVNDVERPVQSVLVLTGALFFLPSLFVGVVSPIATKLAIDREPERSGRVLGRMFAAGASGSIAGTLAAGFVFISWIGTTGTVLSVAALYAVLTGIFALQTRHAMSVIVGLAVIGGGAGAWGHTARALVSPCTTETDYFCIRIDDFTATAGAPSRLMVLDHLVHSINDKADPTLLYSPYLQFVDEVIRHRFPPSGANALAAAYFIGGGGFTLPRAWQHTYPDAHLTVAEIDPAVTQAAVDHLWFEPDLGPVTVQAADARVALQAVPASPRFDVVFGDAFHDISVPAHLVTDEFARIVSDRLTLRGLYVSNIVDTARDPMFVFAFVRTLSAHFDSVEVWLANDVSIADRRVTYIVLAGKEASPAPVLQSRFGLERTWLRWPPDDLGPRIERFEAPVLTDAYAPVDRLIFSGLENDGG